MINVDGKTYRNLEEQVRKNQEDIHSLKFGLNIVGRVANFTLLPADAKIGEAFLVGDHAPYNIFIKTADPKTYDNLGTLASNIPGPQGKDGATGETGNGIYFLELVEPNCDLIVHYTNGETEELGSIKGDQGKQGLTGPRGMRGEQGDKGDRGEVGPAGTTFKLIGEKSSTGELPVPPKNPNEAYLVGGNLYIWVGTLWKNQGPIAQTSVIYGTTAGTSYEGDKGQQNRTDINNLQESVDRLLGIEEISNKLSWRNDKYISASGTVYAETWAQLSKPYLLQPGKIIVHSRGIGTNFGIIATATNASQDNNFNVVAAAHGNTITDYSYEFTEPTYIVVCIVDGEDGTLPHSVTYYPATTTDSRIDVLVDQMDNIYTNNLYFDSVKVQEDMTYPHEHYYSTKDTAHSIGDVYDINSIYSIEQPEAFGGYFPVKKGQKITISNNFTKYGDAKNSILTDINYKILAIYPNEQEHIITPEQDGYLIVSGRIKSTTAPIVTISNHFDFIQINNIVNDIPTNEDIHWNDNDYLTQMVQKVICIGDSVTEGHTVDSPYINKVASKYSYPSQLAKMAHWEVTNAGKSGYDTRKWWNNIFPNYNYSDYELAIIELGYNDAKSEFTNTLATDVEPYQDYHNFADTPCGNYCRIIEAIQEQNPNIFIILVISGGFREPKAEAVQAIAERYSFPVIDLRDKTYINLDTDPQYHGNRTDGSLDDIHFTTYGYLVKAHYIFETIKPILKENAIEIAHKVEKQL